MKRAWNRLCNKVATLVLLVLLAAVSFLTNACDWGEPKAYYGPPPANDSSDDASINDDVAVYYGPMPVDVMDSAADLNEPEIPQTYYGPPPVDTVEEDKVSEIDSIQTLYGPQPVDLIEEDYVVYYGPPPVDAVEDRVEEDYVVYYGPPPVDAVQDIDDDSPMVPLYGPQPVDVTPEDCEPMAYYGPPPCATDDECKANYGPDWYCDTENKVDPGCGEPISYPVCKEK